MCPPSLKRAQDCNCDWPVQTPNRASGPKWGKNWPKNGFCPHGGKGGNFASLISDAKEEHKPKLLSPDIFWWGRGLPRARMGAKKFGMSSKPGKSGTSLETREIKLLGWDIPGRLFCALLRHFQGVSEYGLKSDCESQWALIRSHS